MRYNCSGKHAAMLVTCIANDWPTETYLSPEHPLQVHIRRTIEELAREPVAAVGVDGCGAPLFALTLGGVARAFRALVLAEPGSPERKVADAMRKFPEWTSGTTRDENKLMTSIPGLLLKAGRGGRGRVRAAGRHRRRGQDRRREAARPHPGHGRRPGPARRAAARRTRHHGGDRRRPPVGVIRPTRLL